MVLEIIIFDVIPGKSQEYRKNFPQVQKIISNQKGYISHELQKCVETEDHYMLFIKWQSLIDHSNFTKSASHKELEVLTHHFYTYSKMEHYELLASDTK